MDVLGIELVGASGGGNKARDEELVDAQIVDQTADAVFAGAHGSEMHAEPMPSVIGGPKTLAQWQEYLDAIEFAGNDGQLIGKHLWEEFAEAVGTPFYEGAYRALREQVQGVNRNVRD